MSFILRLPLKTMRSKLEIKIMMISGVFALRLELFIMLSIENTFTCVFLIYDYSS